MPDAGKVKQCSEPQVRHLLVENLHSYIHGEMPQARWVHWKGEGDPKAGDFLKVCDRPAWPSLIATSKETSDA